MSDLARAVALSRREQADLIRALTELAIARLRLATTPVAAVICEPAPPLPRSDSAAPLIDRVATAIPRVAARVPWRATCLVQALAAQRWLTRNGVKTELVLGARKGSTDRVDAHAWLRAGERIVVGGDVSDYRQFIRDPNP